MTDTGDFGAFPPPGHAGAEDPPPSPPPAGPWGAPVPPPAHGQTPASTPAHTPPPGWSPASQAQSVQPSGWVPPPGMLGAAHKPGAIALRPLNLGDMYDATFRIIRFNPQATVGAAVLVAAVAWVIPVAVTGILSTTMDLSLSASDSLTQEEIYGLIGGVGSLLLSVVLQWIGLLLVSGMIAHVVAAAAVGRRLTLREAWAHTRGKRWRLVGLTVVLTLATLLLLGLLAFGLIFIAALLPTSVGLMTLYVIAAVTLFVAVMWWFWVRIYYLPVPALMLEPVGVFAAIGRGFRLSKSQFWRILGIGLLTVIVVQIIGTVIGVPLQMIAGAITGTGIGDEGTLFALTLTTALAAVAQAAFMTPFTAAVTSLQYLDQRMRKDAYDVELMAQAGLIGR